MVTPLPPPPNPGALEGGIWEFSEGQTGRDWELEQLRYLPGQSKQFGNILGGDNQTLAEPSAGGSSQSREEATHQMSWSLGFYEPGGLAGGGFASSEELGPPETLSGHCGGPLHHQDPNTDPWEPLCSLRQPKVSPPLLLPARSGTPVLSPQCWWGYPMSQPGPGGSPPSQGRRRAALTLLFLAPGKAGSS